MRRRAPDRGHAWRIAQEPGWPAIRFAQGEGPRPTQQPTPPATSGPIRLQAIPIEPQTPPEVEVPNSSADQFEHHDDIVSLPRIFARQWSFTNEFPPENLISERYICASTAEAARGLTLKEAIYIALRNNPSLKVALLNPVASVESIKNANGSFDPNLTSQIDVFKTVTPTTSILETGGSDVSFSKKLYDWNFGINKVSSITNGTCGAAFNNDRAASNSLFASVNPAYTPTLTLSLTQPLLQNFGWRFATINVRIAESGQKESQWNYGQTLQDFVQRIGNEYWAVVLTEENLRGLPAPRCASTRTWCGRTRSRSRSARWPRSTCRKRNPPRPPRRPTSTPPRRICAARARSCART